MNITELGQLGQRAHCSEKGGVKGLGENNWSNQTLRMYPFPSLL